MCTILKIYRKTLLKIAWILASSMNKNKHFELIEFVFYYIER
jgi:hypothetical protein